MSDNLNSVIGSLRGLREACLTRLEANEDWRALKVLDRAIDELDTAKGMPEAVPIRAPIVASPMHRSYMQPTLARRQAEARQISQGDAAHAVITYEGPLPIAELVPLVRDKGAQVAGNDPQTNLSSSLSRDGRFKSVRIKGIAHWALKEDPNEAIDGEAGAATPAPDDFMSIEGR